MSSITATLLYCSCFFIRLVDVVGERVVLIVDDLMFIVAASL